MRHRAKALDGISTRRCRRSITQRGRGTPRLALRLLQACHRVCRAEGKRAISLHHFRTACALEHLDDLGLGPIEQAYLKALADGVSRLNVLTSMLGLPARTVSCVVEPFLLRAGLVVKDERAAATHRPWAGASVQIVSRRCPVPVKVMSYACRKAGDFRCGDGSDGWTEPVEVLPAHQHRLPPPHLRRSDRTTVLPA